MGAIEHLTISLPADVADDIRDRVAAGDFIDINAVVLEALRGLALDEHLSSDVGHDQRFRADVRAAYDAWRSNPMDVMSLSEAIGQVKREGRATR